MPKNKGKGGKNRRRGKNDNDFEKRELVIAEEGQCYAQATRMLGNGRLEAYCFNDDKKRLCHIRGKMRNTEEWVSVGDIILIGLRESENNKADVIHKFYPQEVRDLKKKGGLPARARIETGAVAGRSGRAADVCAEGAFEFDEGGEGDEDDVGEGGANAGVARSRGKKRRRG
eukprot:gb/GECG01013295.1/.p1 GENE.gb/GECG01013295.1/~~gb/GECG01013295.1/.p1  ORF type:complete len:172 (+),score=29.27 gb/GECG01013295.1/:1-516(+)